jgi:glutamate synthase domain-containing protein 1
MCGIAGLQLRDPQLYPQLGALLTDMLCQVAERGPDSAGFGVYADPAFTPVDSGRTDLTVERLGDSLTVVKGVGGAAQLAADTGLAAASGWQALAHTRMATESAVTVAHGHPFTAPDDFCLVHNGSFSNYASIRRELMADGVTFHTDNDSEVAARFIAAQLHHGDDLDKALRRLSERFDGFYTLLVTTADALAVVRDPIACKPALIAENTGWVAMASEYRALVGLPGMADARVFEPAPEEVYLWSR